MQLPQHITFRVVALGLAVVMLAGATYYKLVPRTETPQPIVSTGPTIEDANSRMALDSDNDGVPDWQEFLYGSDPLNASSTPDTTESKGGATDTSATSSGTTVLARNLVLGYLEASQNGTKTLSDPNAFGEALAGTIAEPEVAYTVVVAKDIHTTENTPETQSAYVKALKKAVDPISDISEPEIATYGRLVEGDASANADLAKTIAIYKSVAKDLQSITVPKNALVVHLGAINAVGYYAAVLDTMRMNTTDSIGSLALLRTYNEAEQYMFSGFGALSSYLAQH